MPEPLTRAAAVHMYLSDIFVTADTEEEAAEKCAWYGLVRVIPYEGPIYETKREVRVTTRRVEP